MSPDNRLEHGADAANVISDIQRYFRQIIDHRGKLLNNLNQPGSMEVVRAVGLQVAAAVFTANPIDGDGHDTQAPERVDSKITIQDIAVQLKVLDRNGQQVVWEFLWQTDRDSINLPKFLADLLDAINEKPGNPDQGKKVAKFLNQLSLQLATASGFEKATAYYAAMLNEELTKDQLLQIEGTLETDEELSIQVFETDEDAEDIFIENLLKLIQEKLSKEEISH